MTRLESGELVEPCATWQTGPFDRIIRHRLSLVLLTLLVGIVHGPSVGFDFVNWDDPWYVTENAWVQGWTWENLLAIATEPVARNYAPLTVLSFLIDHTFWGLNPAGYHLTNVLLHLINVWLVWWLVHRLAGQPGLALACGVFFAIHPVQVETVAWVSSRKTLLSTTCMLACGLCWLCRERTAKQELWGTFWLWLALLSKASAIVVPPIVLLYDRLIRRQPWSESLARQIFPGLMCLICLNLTMGAQTTIVGGIRSHIGLSKLEIIGIDAILLVHYVGMILRPANLCVLYDVPIEGIFWPALTAGLLWTGLFAWAWSWRDRAPWITWLPATWLLLLFPMLNFFPLTTLMNDRYLYLPCVPMFIMLWLGTVRAAGWTRSLLCRVQCEPAASRRLLASGRGLCSVLLCGLIVSAVHLTQRQLEVWRNPRTLWSHAMQHAPELAVVRIQWALTLHAEGEVTQAREVLLSTLEECRLDTPDRERVLRKLREWM